MSSPEQLGGAQSNEAGATTATYRITPSSMKIDPSPGCTETSHTSSVSPCPSAVPSAQVPRQFPTTRARTAKTNGHTLRLPDVKRTLAVAIMAESSFPMHAVVTSCTFPSRQVMPERQRCCGVKTDRSKTQ